MLPQFGMINLMFVLPKLFSVLEGAKTLSLQKGFSPMHINYQASLWYRPGHVNRMIIVDLALVLCLRVCLGRD